MSPVGTGATAAKAAVIAVTGGEEVIRFTSSPKAKDETVVVLFEIDGTEYTVPARPRANISLQFMRDLRSVGENIAVANMLTALLGEDGFNALADYEDLTMEQMKQVIDVAQRLIFGELNAATGN